MKPKLGPGKLAVGSSRQLASANGRQQPQLLPARFSSYPLPSSGHGTGSNKYLDKAESASKPLPQCTAMSLLGHSRPGRSTSKSRMPYCFGSTPTRGVSSYDIVAWPRPRAVVTGRAPGIPTSLGISSCGSAFHPKLCFVASALKPPRKAPEPTERETACHDQDHP